MIALYSALSGPVANLRREQERSHATVSIERVSIDEFGNRSKEQSGFKVYYPQYFNSGKFDLLSDSETMTPEQEFQRVIESVASRMKGGNIDPGYYGITNSKTSFKSYIITNMSDVPMFYLKLDGDNFDVGNMEIRITSLMPQHQLGIVMMNDESLSLSYTSKADQRIEVRFKDGNFSTGLSYVIANLGDRIIEDEKIFPFNNSNYTRSWDIFN